MDFIQASTDNRQSKIISLPRHETYKKHVTFDLSNTRFAEDEFFDENACNQIFEPFKTHTQNVSNKCIFIISIVILLIATIIVGICLINSLIKTDRNSPEQIILDSM